MFVGLNEEPLCEIQVDFCIDFEKIECKWNCKECGLSHSIAYGKVDMNCCSVCPRKIFFGDSKTGYLCDSYQYEQYVGTHIDDAEHICQSFVHHINLHKMGLVSSVR